MGDFMITFLKYFVLVCYFVVIACLGIYAHRKTKTVSDYVVGGRTIGPWRTAFSYGAANFSAGIFIGFAGTVGWAYGFNAIWAAVFGATLLSTYLPWRILAPRAREMTQRLRVLTMPAFFEARYQSNNMRTLASVITFVFFIPYAASLLMGLSYLFEQVFQIPYLIVVAMMAIFAGLYLFLGGYMAVTLVDFVQGGIMLAGAILVALCVFRHPQVSGIAEGLRSLHEIDPHLLFSSQPMTWLGLCVVVLATGLGPWGLPDMVQRFYGIKNIKVIPLSRRACTCFALIISVCAYGIGATGHLFFEEVPIFEGKATTDLIVPMIIGQLPPLVGAIMLVLILSASMSTISAMILSASSSVGIDLIKNKVNKNIDEKKMMLLLRLLCIIFLAIAFAIALRPPDIMMNLITLTVGTVSGSFMAIFLYGLYWPRTSKAGAWAGMVTGFTVAVGGFLFLNHGDALAPPLMMATIRSWGMPFFCALAIFLPLLVVPLVSILTKPFREDHLRYIFQPSKINSNNPPPR